MRKLLMLGVGTLCLGAASLATAQPTPPPPQAGAEAPANAPESRPRSPGGPEMRHGPGMHGRHHMMPPPPPGSTFSFRRGDTAVRIQCSERQPIQACVDAAGALFDKFNAGAR